MIVVRALNPADASEYQAVRLFGLRESPSAFSSSYEDECNRTITTVAKLLESGPARTVFGAFAEEKLVGIVGVGREQGMKVKHRGFIRSMYVRPEYRGRGVARQLVVTAIEHAAAMPGLIQLALTVTSGNDAATALYESLGFIRYGLVPQATLVNKVYYDEIEMLRWMESN